MVTSYCVYIEVQYLAQIEEAKEILHRKFLE